MEPVADREQAGGGVRHHHRDQERADPVRAPLDARADLVLEADDPADAGAGDHRGPPGSMVPSAAASVRPAWSTASLAAAIAEEAHAVDAPGLAGVHPRRGIEVVGLGGEADGLVRRVPGGDRRGGRPGGEHRGEGRIGVAGRGDRSDAGDGDAGAILLRSRRCGHGDQAASVIRATTTSAASPMVFTPSRSSSGILRSNRSSSDITTSTRSRLSASRSSPKLVASVRSARSACSSSTQASFTASTISVRSISAVLLLLWGWGLREVKWSVAHAEAAVDGDHGAGDVGGGVAAQEGDRGGHLGRIGEPPERDGSGQLGPPFLRQGAEHLGVDRARGDGVGGDRAPGQLAGEGTG